VGRRTVILDVFGSDNALSSALDHAIRLLLLAGHTARRYRVGDRSERVLGDSCWPLVGDTSSFLAG